MNRQNVGSVEEEQAVALLKSTGVLELLRDKLLSDKLTDAVYQKVKDRICERLLEHEVVSDWLAYVKKVDAGELTAPDNERSLAKLQGQRSTVIDEMTRHSNIAANDVERAVMAVISHKDFVEEINQCVRDSLE